MTKFYFDTSVWRDYYENRQDRFRPLGEWALALINKAIQNENLILYSDFVITELQTGYNEKQIDKIFEIMEKTTLLVKVSTGENQVKEAAKLCKEKKVSFGDALHAILARDNNAILISRDKHFIELNDIVEVKKPEDLI